MGKRQGFGPGLGIGVGWTLAVVFLLVAAVLAASAPVFADGITFADGGRIKFGGSLHIAPDEVVDGDVVLMGGSLRVDGTVNGNAVVFGGSSGIDGEVRGDVVVFGGSVRLGPTARVGGDVTAMGGSIRREGGAVIEGDADVFGGWDALRYVRIPFFGWIGPAGSFVWHLITMAGLFTLALIVVSFVPGHVQRAAHAIEAQPGRSFVIGLLALILVGPAVLITVVTIIGIPVGLAIILAFVLAKFMGYVAAVQLIGDRVGDRAESMDSPIVRLLVGVVILGLVRYVPVVGALVSFFVTTFSIGAVLDTKFGTGRPWIPPRQDSGPTPTE